VKTAPKKARIYAKISTLKFEKSSISNKNFREYVDTLGCVECQILESSAFSHICAVKALKIELLAYRPIS